MANPSPKNEDLENAIEGMLGFNRAETIQENKCVPPPFGCGKPVSMDDFKDDLSRKEYSLSGMCQTCQDEFFKPADQQHEDIPDDFEDAQVPAVNKEVRKSLAKGDPDFGCQHLPCTDCGGYEWCDGCQVNPACACKHGMGAVPSVVMGPGGNPKYMHRASEPYFAKHVQEAAKTADDNLNKMYRHD